MLLAAAADNRTRKRRTLPFYIQEAGSGFRLAKTYQLGLTHPPTPTRHRYERRNDWHHRATLVDCG